MVKYPEDWKKIPFDESFEVLRNNTCSRALMTEVSGIVQNIHYGDVLVKYGAILDCQNDEMPYLTEEGTRIAAQDYAQDGDVIFADTAEDETCGKVVEIVNVGVRKVVAGLHTVFCRPKIGCFTPGWLGYWMNSSAYHDQLHSLMTGIKVLSVSKSSLSKTYIMVPKKDEQKRIADVLGNVDKLIDNLSRRIEKKRLVKQGVMQDLLTGKKRLPGFEGEWNRVALGELLDYEQPQPYIIKSAEYAKEGVPVLTAGKTFVLGHVHEFEGVYDKVPVILFDDFLTVARFVDFPFKVKSSAAKMLSLKDASNSLLFVFMAMRSIGYVPGDHQRHWISIFSKFEIELPSPIEQKAIAKVLGDMDGDIAKLESKLEKYRKLKQGLMGDLLTGKVRLK